ncbi:MAG: hypothetical protein NTY03_03395 [Candidatus Bathyarchaeota archaeon]|nr:hypothetical protein [Candidatus Bathyarchaeota archaeon]
MVETIYYARLEAGFEAVPAENYVDYMTNVIPVLERHIFYLPRKGIGIICEVKIDPAGGRVLMWSLREYDNIPANVVEIQVEEKKIDAILVFLNYSDLPRKCDICDENLGALLRFF